MSLKRISIALYVRLFLRHDLPIDQGHGRPQGLSHLSPAESLLHGRDTSDGMI
jgi:hypothetical protein